MGKKAAYYEVAKKMYVVERRALDEIAKELGVSVAELARWKNEGNWDEARVKLRAEKEHFMDIYNEVRLKLLKKAKAMLGRGKDIDSKTLFTLLNIVRAVKPPTPEIQREIEAERQSEKMSPDEMKERLKEALSELGIKL